MGLDLSGSTVVESIPVLKRNLGITDIEAKVVLSIFLGGNLTSGGIVEITGESRRKVGSALKRLEKKGLIRKVDGVVEVYRLAPTILALDDVLSSIKGDLGSFSEETRKLFEAQFERVDQNIEVVLESHKNTIDDGRVALQSYESNTIDTVQSQIDTVATLATQVLSEFAQSIEEALTGLDVTLDEGLGTRLTALQQELDKSQKALDHELNKTTRSFKRVLTAEHKSSAAAVDGLRSKIAALVASLSASLSSTLQESRRAVQVSGEQMSSRISEESTGASDSAIAALTTASEDLEAMLSKLDAQLSSSYLAGEGSLNEMISRNRDQVREEAEFAKTRIEEAIQLSETVRADVEEWKAEVAAFMDVATQSLKSQLDQIQSTETKYLENVKTAASGLIDKTQKVFDDEYESLKDMATNVHTEFEANLGTCRKSTLALLEKQLNAHEEKLDKANLQAITDIDNWSKRALTSMNQNLTQVVEEVSAILDTEASEIDTLAEAINSRLKSAYNTVMKTSATKQESALTSVKKITHEFEADVGERLSEVIAGYAETTKSQITEAKALYGSFNKRVDKRLESGVSALTSHANRVQKEIDQAIEEQVARIDEHSEGIRNEFHVQVEDITRQFINLTKSIEATFNGFLSSQTTEARDLIASVHTEFKGSLKSEIGSLQEDSQKLQQEFSVELNAKVDELVGAVDGMRKALEDLTVEKRTEISKSMADALSGIEDAVRSTQDALKEMETGTIRQFADNIVQVSKEFKSTVNSARDSIAERVVSVTDTAESSMSKNTAKIKSVIDTYFTEQDESREKLLASTSKKMDGLASKLLKSSNERVEKFQTSLAKKDASRSEAVRTTREQAVAAIEERRNEVALAFIGASEGLETAAGNLTSSLEQLGTKLNAEMATLASGITKAADKVASKIGERGEKRLKDYEGLSRALLKKSEASLRKLSTEFGEKSTSLLTNVGEGFSDMPETFKGIIDASVAEATEKVDEYCHGATAAIDSSFSKFTELAQPVAEEAHGLLERVSTLSTKHVENALSEAKQGVLVSNQFSARKLESIGLDLKTHLGGETARLVEKVRSDLTSKNSEIGASASKAATDTKEGMSVLRQGRNDALNSLAEHVDKTMRQWGTEQKKTLSTIESQIDEAVQAVSEITNRTMETLEAVKASGEELLAVPSDRTWYVTGSGEICAHMQDMVARAEESVVISVLSLDCLNLKKLAKSKAPRRRILIIPEMEEASPELQALKGWRIWQTASPTTLAVKDDSEILIGGSEESDSDLAIVSTESSYLQLYQHFLGPRLTSGRKSGS